jgi:uncharacterized protein YndB with AHSA1/START domain
MSGDQARVSVAVAVAPELAFEIFTAHIDAWWRRGMKFRNSASTSSLIRIEPEIGGRLFETFGENDPVLVEVGRVLAWDPPRSLKFSWRNTNFGANEVTEVQVEFAATRSGTLVTVTHSGFAALRADHPARHGLHGADFSRMIGLWWGDQMNSLRMICAALSSNTKTF